MSATLAEKKSEEELGEAAIGESGKAEDASFPVVVFSHGLGGFRTTYSQYCGDLASHGSVVFAIESRDGSGPASLVVADRGAKVRHASLQRQQMKLKWSLTLSMLFNTSDLKTCPSDPTTPSSRNSTFGRSNS